MSKCLWFALMLTLSGTMAASAETVRLGLDVWLGYGPLWVAEDKGYFDNHGVDVELKVMHLDKGMRVALRNGDIDVAASPTNGLILEVNRGIEHKAFLILDTSLQADAILAGPAIGDIIDLRGKAIAYETGTTSDLLLGYALKVNGMLLADIVAMPTAASEAGPALAAGEVEAAVTYEPYISATLAENNTIKIVYSAAHKPGLISDVLASTPDWIETHPDEVRGIIRAWDDAVKFIRENRDEGLRIVADAIDRPTEAIEPAFSGLRLYRVEENVEFLDGDFQATIADIAAIMQDIHPEDFKTLPLPDELLSLDDLRAVAEQPR